MLAVGEGGQIAEEVIGSMTAIASTYGYRQASGLAAAGLEAIDDPKLSEWSPAGPKSLTKRMNSKDNSCRFNAWKPGCWKASETAGSSSGKSLNEYSFNASGSGSCDLSHRSIPLTYSP